MKKVVAVVLAVILCAACESKSTTENSTITISVVPPQTAEAQVVQEVNPCDSQFATRKVDVRELKLKELRKIKFERYDVDNDDELNYEDYTELTYSWDIVEINSKKAHTAKSVPEILKYYYQRGAREITEHFKKVTFGDIYLPEILGEFESIAYQEKIFNQVINSPGAIATQAAFLLKTIPNGKELALNWGKWFIERYKNLDWNAEVGVLKKRTTVTILGKDGDICGHESENESYVLQYSHPARRDSQGRFINEGLKQCVRDDYSNWGTKDDYFCPVVVFQNQNYENGWTYFDKQVWRAGPKFYANTVNIIHIVWNELGVTP